MFNQQPSPLNQVFLRVLNNDQDVFQTIWAADQGREGFVLELCQMRVLGFNVGRVAGDHLKLPLNVRQPIALCERHWQCQLLRIVYGQGEGIGA